MVNSSRSVLVGAGSAPEVNAGQGHELNLTSVLVKSHHSAGGWVR